MQQTINLEDHPAMGIFRFASAQASKGFTQAKDNRHSICQFVKKHKLRRIRCRTLKSGSVRVSVVTKEGEEKYAIHNNFSLAYSLLVEKFRIY